MSDEWLYRALESGEYVDLYTVHIDVTCVRADAWRAEADLQRLGEDGLSGALASTGATAEEALDLLTRTATDTMTAWSKGPHGRPGLLDFQITTVVGTAPS
jgi:hypothetical protein